MSFAFRLLLALLGLLWLRTALYQENWGHGGRLKAIVNGGLGLLIMVPLWRFSAAIARDWGTLVEKTPEKGLVTVLRPASDDVSEAWVGNVLTHVRSLNPSVRTSLTYRMWATVIRLPGAPRFTSAIMRGWSSPKYHTSEWRVNIYTTLSKGDVQKANLDFLERLAAAVVDPPGGRASTL
ncbi:MAG: hypothetical protein BMS9Abin29_0798 [Gemmatimonadota bacterium]|nr:MAG: hypothetical protein BMS9Abin29_0798 [Gemmatimonadota bacterium]